jgi:hypothetical protein
MPHERQSDGPKADGGSETADGTNYRVSDDPGSEMADGSNYRGDAAEGSETADGSKYRAQNEPPATGATARRGSVQRLPAQRLRAV